MAEEMAKVPIVPDGDFEIHLYTYTQIEMQHKHVATFVVSHDVLAEKCPALIADSEGNLKLCFFPAFTTEASRAMEFVLNKLHDLSDVNSAGDQEMNNPGNGCLMDLEIRDMFWAVRITKELQLTLPGFSSKDVEAWYLNLREKVGGDVQALRDWYVLGPIARYMNLGDLYRCIIDELHNDCVAEPWESPEEADWIDKNGQYFAFLYEWPALDPHFESMLGVKQRRINQTKRNALMKALGIAICRLRRQETTPTAKGCTRCPTMPYMDFFHALSILYAGTERNNCCPSLRTLLKRLSDLRDAWAKDPERRAMVNTSKYGCDAFKHLIELGEQFISIDAPTKLGVEFLISA